MWGKSFFRGRDGSSGDFGQSGFTPPTEADKLFRILRHSAPDILDESIPQLDESLGRLRTAENRRTIPDRKRLDVIDSIQELTQQLSNLRYGDYRELMGELRFWRSQSPASVDPFPVIAKRVERKDSSPTIKSILSQFSSAYEASLTFIKDPDKHPFQFVEDSLMLMRCVCPLGVNMLNPSWTEGLSSFSDRQPVAVELGNSGMDEHGRGRVWTPKDRLLIVPADEYSITSKIYYYPSEYLKSGEGAPKLIGELQDGESVVVGRKLKMFSFYGVGSDFALTKVEVGAHVENDAYSRGCLRFLKLNGIFCFNAGARREFAAYGFDGTNWQLANFEGVHEAAGNTMVFGRSQVTRLDFKPNFEDPSSSSSSEKS